MFAKVTTFLASSKLKIGIALLTLLTENQVILQVSTHKRLCTVLVVNKQATMTDMTLMHQRQLVLSHVLMLGSMFC